MAVETQRMEDFRLEAEPYYLPLERRMADLLPEYRDNPAVQELFKGTQREIDIYRKYSDWYGYVFYVMQAD